MFCSPQFVVFRDKSSALLHVASDSEPYLTRFQEVMSSLELVEGTGLDIGSGRQDAGDDAGIDSPNCLDQSRA